MKKLMITTPLFEVHARLQNTVFVWTFVLTLVLTLRAGHTGTASAQEAITLPAPRGEFAVGMVELQLTDQARPETFTDDPNDVRELMTTIYYPAYATATAEAAPYGHDALQVAVREFPGIEAARWSSIVSSAVVGVPLASDQDIYPVILFSPGLATLPVFYTTLLAEIASHGYVVISISHTYTTRLTVLADGRAISSNEAGLDIDGRRGDTFFDAQDRRNRVNSVWVNDLRFVIDQLESLNQDDELLGGHLDLSKIGVVGHSFGGSAGAQAAYLDSRIGAAISMDSWLDGEVALEGLTQPYLLMEPANPDYEDPNQAPSDEHLDQLGLTRADLDMLRLRAGHGRLLESSSAGYRLRLTGAAHSTFTTDLLIFAPYFPNRINAAMVGTINGEIALRIVLQYSVEFFELHLKGAESPLFSGEGTAHEAYPEVLFERF